MQKCYIAGPVSGLDEKEYRASFRKAEIAVAIMGYEPVNPVELPHNHDKTWLSCMREAITEMMKCDMVYVHGDWEQSRGASIEVQLAKDLGIPITYNVYLRRRDGKEI
jgi:hypothetical protein